MVKPGRVALQPADDLAQARGPGKLAVQQGDELVFGGQSTDVFVRPMLIDQALERIPGKTLQHIVEYSIVMPHGVDPHPCPNRREMLGRQ